MSSTTTTNTDFILDCLQCYCGKAKVMGAPFCIDCYYTLPPAARRFVRYLKSPTYRGAYDAAVEFIEREKNANASAS